MCMCIGMCMHVCVILKVIKDSDYLILTPEWCNYPGKTTSSSNQTDDCTLHGNEYIYHTVTNSWIVHHARIILLSLICMYTPQNLVTIHITYASRFILSNPASNTSSNMICCPWFQLIWFYNSTQQHWKSIRGHEVLLWSELWCESADHCIPHLSSSVQTFRPAVVIADHIASSKL